jgi:hypothetical protein
VAAVERDGDGGLERGAAGRDPAAASPRSIHTLLPALRDRGGRARSAAQRRSAADPQRGGRVGDGRLRVTHG